MLGSSARPEPQARNTDRCTKLLDGRVEQTRAAVNPLTLHILCRSLLGRSSLGPPALVRACRSTAPSWYPNRALLSALQHARPHPLMFVPISFADASAIVALGAGPRRGPLTLALFGGLSVSFPWVCLVLAPATCFIDSRTLPARRGASKKSRLNDHGPLQDPRDRRFSRASAFLTRRSFRAGLLTPSKTERRHRTAHKEKRQ